MPENNTDNIQKYLHRNCITYYIGEHQAAAVTSQRCVGVEILAIRKLTQNIFVMPKTSDAVYGIYKIMKPYLKKQTFSIMQLS